jgi:hypothetical protein
MTLCQLTPKQPGVLWQQVCVSVTYSLVFCFGFAPVGMARMGGGAAPWHMLFLGLAVSSDLLSMKQDAVQMSHA